MGKIMFLLFKTVTSKTFWKMFMWPLKIIFFPLVILYNAVRGQEKMNKVNLALLLFTTFILQSVIVFLILWMTGLIYS